MSKITGFGFVLLDGVTTIMLMANQSLTMILLAMAVTSSIVLACASSAFRSLCAPDYFWD